MYGAPISRTASPTPSMGVGEAVRLIGAPYIYEKDELEFRG